MYRSILIPALALAALAAATAQAQSPPSAAKTDSPGIRTDEARNLPQEIRDRLKAEGFKDVEVVPNSFIVSAKDKNDNPVMMLIGPNGTTVVKKSKAGPPSGPPSTAEHREGQDQIIQE
jgi:hypothetical protein